MAAIVMVMSAWAEWWRAWVATWSQSPSHPVSRWLHHPGRASAVWAGPGSQWLAAASAVMPSASSGRSATYWPARRRYVAGRSKVVPAGVQDGDQVEQAERGDACLAGLLPQGVVVAPEGELAVLGDGDRVGRGAGCRGQLACLRGGGGGLEGFGPVTSSSFSWR